MKESDRKYLVVWGLIGWEVFNTETKTTVAKGSKRFANNQCAGRDAAYRHIEELEDEDWLKEISDD